LTIRIGNRKYGKGRYSAPAIITVFKELAPLELSAEYVKTVAPGQWLDLQAASLEPLKRSERTEVEFRQGNRSIVVAASNPRQPHFPVPASLSAGEVEVRARTSWQGKVSAWSNWETLRLAEHPTALSVDSMRLEKGNWVDLGPGPERAARFNASA